MSTPILEISDTWKIQNGQILAEVYTSGGQQRSIVGVLAVPLPQDLANAVVGAARALVEERSRELAEVVATLQKPPALAAVPDISGREPAPVEGE